MLSHVISQAVILAPYQVRGRQQRESNTNASNFFYTKGPLTLSSPRWPVCAKRFGEGRGEGLGEGNAAGYSNKT